jgi:uncharacterized protein YndB with AHSA1/START domain
MENENNDTTGREQRTSVLLNAPVEIVWQVWTKPEHIKHWWGPDGFSNTIEKMQVEPGGEWIFTMHGPEEQDYPNRTIFREVVQHKKLVHEHFDPNFIAIIEFETQGNNTLLHWYKLYESKELFELVEKHHKSNEGFKQTVEKLKAYLEKNKSKV